MNTKHMFAIEITSKGFRTHIVDDNGEVTELRRTKQEIKNLQVFETYLATTYPYCQVPIDRKLIQGDNHVPMVAPGPLGNNLTQEHLEPQQHSFLSVDIFERPTQEEIDQAEERLYLHNIEQDTAGEVFNLESEIDTINLDNEAPEPIYQETNIINPLNTEKMETNKSVETQPKVPMMDKVKWYSAVTAGHATVAITGPTHFMLQTAADTLQAMANGVASIEAYTIDKLEIAEESREEIRQAVTNRTRRYQSYATAPVRAAKNIIDITRMAASADLHVEQVS